MTAPRTILTRAALLLGATLLLAILTGAAPSLPPLVASACEPDGVGTDVALGWARVERDLNEYARARGYSVTLSLIPPRHQVAGYVVTVERHDGTPERGVSACFYVPSTVPEADVVSDVWRRTAETMAALDRVQIWTDE